MQSNVHLFWPSHSVYVCVCVFISYAHFVYADVACEQGCLYKNEFHCHYVALSLNVLTIFLLFIFVLT